MIMFGLITLTLLGVGSVLRAKRHAIGGLVCSSLGAGLCIAGTAIVLLSGCPGLPPPDGCPPWTQRCSADGVPEVCSGSQRWTRADRPCAASGTVCCRAFSPLGREVYACVPASTCVAEPDAGTAAGDDGGTQ